MKTIPYLFVTTIAVVIGHVWSWSRSGLGPMSALIVLAALQLVLRQMRKARGHRAAPGTFPAESSWTLIAFCALAVGGFAGMLAYNPDGYMQPKPSGAPWLLIIPGTLIGAVGGVIVAWFLSLKNRLTAPPRR